MKDMVVVVALNVDITGNSTKYGQQSMAERIAVNKSVNKICKELGIGKQTFYSWMEEYQLKR